MRSAIAVMTDPDLIWQIIGERGKLTRREAKMAAAAWKDCLRTALAECLHRRALVHFTPF